MYYAQLYTLYSAQNPVGSLICPLADVRRALGETESVRAVRIDVHLELYTVVAKPLSEYERILDIDSAVVGCVPQEAFRRLVSDAVLKREIVFLIFILFTKQILTAADMTEFVGDVDYRIAEYRAVRQRRVFVDIVGSVTFAGDVIERDGRSREVSATRFGSIFHSSA